MVDGLKRKWREVQQLEPGKRFKTLYERHRKSSSGKSPWRRAALFIAALVSLAIGVVLAFIPGPAVVFFALAGGLLAIQSRHVASALDFAEVRLRRFAAKAKRWKREHFPTLSRSARH